MFGSKKDFDARLLTSLPSTALTALLLTASHADDWSGISVSSAGDINGDGFDDLIIGAAYASPNGYFVRAELRSVWQQDRALTPALDLSTLNGTNGFTINGIAARDESGLSVSSAGDINGDGIDDLIIGANCADPQRLLFGQSYVVFGT